MRIYIAKYYSSGSALISFSIAYQAVKRCLCLMGWPGSSCKNKEFFKRILKGLKDAMKR